VLRGVAQTLAANLRASDLLGRVGGEEFAVLLPHTDVTAALRVAEGLRLAVESLMPDIGSQQLRVTASIGVASDAGNGTLQSTQHAADEAMYRAKSLGRNRVSVLELVPTIGG
jgi:diguanylate cyclase (GGDEF)-like protein